VRRGRIGFWMRLAEMMARPQLWAFTQPTWRGQEHVPASGPAILVANHISYADPLVLAHYVFDRPREIRMLAKASMFELPLLGRIVKNIDQIPVHRESVDAARALDAAVEAVRGGGAVIIYPEGTCTKDPDLWPMQGKTGAARLALVTGAPVIPIAQWGAQEIHHPVTGKLRLRPRTPVTVAAGPPVDLSAFAGATPTQAVLRDATDVIMRRLRSDVAALRGEPCPTGPLFVPPRGAEPPASTPQLPSPEVSS
jgi:1-acyl-sn-glycerol-3-phosphate acyltransferase